jgi:SAM-dependent methyltransferase
MSDFWESKFKSEGPLWGFFPSDSAIEAVNIFKTGNFKKILIPGMGYGRNAGLFIENGFNVTGIEISRSAIDLAYSSGINSKIYHGSVTSMPFDTEIYDGVFCYALIHVLNQTDRKRFLKACFNQLKNNGIMIFVITSVENSMFGSGRKLSKNRFEISKGLKVFFYDKQSIENEFVPFGLSEFKEIDEPIKFMTGQAPLKMYRVICRKKQ